MICLYNYLTASSGIKNLFGTDSANLKVRQYYGVTTAFLKSINIWIEDTSSHYCFRYEKKSSMCSHALRNFVSLTHCEETVLQ